MSLLQAQMISLPDGSNRKGKRYSLTVVFTVFSVVLFDRRRR